MTEDSAAGQLAQVVLHALSRGKAVEIDGLGTFFPDRANGCRFQPRAPQVFLAYVREDLEAATRLHDALRDAGLNPWMDVYQLLPGQNWARAIERAIDRSDFFVPCFSQRSVNKWGGFQAEIRYALDCARRVPLDEIFVVPVRLDACRVPRSLQKELQYIDLLPDWEGGLRRLLATLLRRTLA
ncbi:MAG TPA: toll/interleukin-1 receptor domain-containing protein [Bryobacteraceae bacterium]|nr:toll/interleukin-1 receptor domain-containing protein [Bryobacteraceae bacterium]